ncbi:MAG: cytochrome c [Betaproteobacteria bacterium]
MNSKLFRVLAIASALVAGQVAAADIEAGKKKAQEVCAACHNMDGVSTVPDYPKLAGQYPDYMAKALRDYKSQARKNPIMVGMAAGLTQKEIDDVAAYYGSLNPVVQTRM